MELFNSYTPIAFLLDVSKHLFFNVRTSTTSKNYCHVSPLAKESTMYCKIVNYACKLFHELL